MSAEPIDRPEIDALLAELDRFGDVAGSGPEHACSKAAAVIRTLVAEIQDIHDEAWNVGVERDLLD